MTTIQQTTQNIDTMIGLLHVLPSVTLTTKNKEDIYRLYTDLIDINGSQNLLSVGNSTDVESISTADLIQFLLTEIGKTKTQLIIAQANQIKDNNKTRLVKADEVTTKINEAIKKQAEADELNEQLTIAGYVVTAVALLISVICVFLAPSVSAVAGLTVAILFTCLQYIPVDDLGTTITEKATKELSNRIYKDLIVDTLREELRKHSDLKAREAVMTDDEVIDFVHQHGDEYKIELYIYGNKVSLDSSDKVKQYVDYTAMAITIYAQFAVTISTTAIAAGIDKSISGGVGGATSAVGTTVTSGLASGSEIAGQVATRTAKEVIAAIAQQLKNFLTAHRLAIQRLINVVTVLKATTSLGVNATAIDGAIVQYEADKSQAEVDESQAFIKYLLSIIAADEALLKQLVQSQVEDSQAVRRLLESEHHAFGKLTHTAIA